MKKQIFIALAAVLTFAACNDNDMLDDQQPVNPQNKTEEPTEGPTVPLNVTALNGEDDSSAAAPRKIAADRTASGVTLTWESTDQIEVFLGSGLAQTTLSTPSLQNENKKAIFSGNVATGGQTVTASTPVYSYVKSSYTTYNASTNDVTIDLTAQDNQTNSNGSIKDAVLHNFFYASTTYGEEGNVTFNYENKLAIMELVISDLFNESGAGTVTFSADAGIPSSVTFDLATGNVKSVGSTSGVVATNVLFVSGAAKCYVAIVPNTTAITNAKVRIDINGHYYEQPMKNTSIAAGSLQANKVYKQNVKKARVPIGSWLFSDGTWGEKNVDAPTKTIVGVVFENQPTAEDVGKGYTHGYAIALEDLHTGVGEWWADMNLDAGFGYIGIMKGDSWESAKVALMSEPSGLAYTKTLVDKPTVWGVKAAKTAYNYIDTNGMHSFLPSAGYIYRMLINLGGLSADQAATIGGDGLASEAEEIKWVGSGSAVYGNLGESGVLNIDSGKTANAPITGNFANDTEYWTSTQVDTNEAYCVNISPTSYNYIFLDAENKPGPKTVRPAIAF